MKRGLFPRLQDRQGSKGPLHVWPAVALLGLIALAFYRSIVMTNLILPGADAISYFYPYRAYAAQAICSGRTPLWNPFLFLGVPFLANPQAAVFYPLNMALCWLPAPKLVAWSAVIHIALAAISAFLYARLVMKLSFFPALLGASTFAFGGFLSGQTEHINQLNVLAWFPLLLLLWEGRRSAPWRCLLGMGVVIGVELLAGHAQSTYISLSGLGIYVVLSSLTMRNSRGQTTRWRGQVISRLLIPLWNAMWPIVSATLIGASLAAVQLVPTLELTRLSIRNEGLSYREAVAFSLKPLPRLLRYTFLPPWGHNLSNIFGGDFFTEYLAYLGIAPLLLAALAVILFLLRTARIVTHTSHQEHSAQVQIKLIILSALGIFLALGLYNPLYWVLYKVVPGFGLFRVPARWLFLYAFGAAMLSGMGLQEIGNWLSSLPVLGQMRIPAQRILGHTSGVLFFILALIELWTAARVLPLRNPTAPGAFSSLRTAPAHLLAAQKQDIAPGRFLSMSDTLFDPGDLGEIQQIFQDQLSEKALYDYIVDIKRQEILAPNLPLAWQVYAVDGYDGGVLPLARYVQMQRLFLDPEAILTDGRLREGLERIPSSSLLSMLGVRYVITDKVHDKWIDNVFYDLTFDALLEAGEGSCQGSQSVASKDIPPFQATALGVVAQLEPGSELKEGAPVATVLLASEDGSAMRFILHADKEASERRELVTQLKWESPARITRIEIAALPFGGKIHIRGVTLIDARDGSNVPLILSTSGHFRQVHSGDVKIYQVLDALPRAYIVHQTRIIKDDERALGIMQEAGSSPGEGTDCLNSGQGRVAFDPAKMAILASGLELDGLPIDDRSLSNAENTLRESTVSAIVYEPEEIVLHATLQTPGYVVLSDSWYPGWKATVDGQPARIERANLLFRAVYVPAGTHIIHMAYKPKSYTIGGPISVVTLIGLMIGGIASTNRSPPKGRPER